MSYTKSTSLFSTLESRHYGVQLPFQWRQSFKNSRRRHPISSAAIIPPTGLHCIYLGFDCTGNYLVSYSLNAAPGSAQDDLPRLQYWRVDPSGRKKNILHFQTHLLQSAALDNDIHRPDVCAICFADMPSNPLAHVVCLTSNKVTHSLFLPRPAVITLHPNVAVPRSWAVLYPQAHPESLDGSHRLAESQSDFCELCCSDIMDEISHAINIQSMCNGNILLSLQDNWHETVEIKLASLQLSQLPPQLQFPDKPDDIWFAYSRDCDLSPKQHHSETETVVYDLIRAKLEIEVLLARTLASEKGAPLASRVLDYRSNVIGLLRGTYKVVFQVCCGLRAEDGSFKVRVYFFQIDMQCNWNVSALRTTTKSFYYGWNRYVLASSNKSTPTFYSTPPNPLSPYTCQRRLDFLSTRKVVWSAFRKAFPLLGNSVSFNASLYRLSHYGVCNSTSTLPGLHHHHAACQVIMCQL